MANPPTRMTATSGVNAASPTRLEAAWALASHPGSPRRALTAFGGDWAASPTDYLYGIADQPPQVL
jgi:hypothetical protein